MGRRDRLGDIERGDDRDVETQEAVVALVAGVVVQRQRKDLQVRKNNVARRRDMSERDERRKKRAIL